MLFSKTLLNGSLLHARGDVTAAQQSQKYQKHKRRAAGMCVWCVCVSRRAYATTTTGA